MKKFVVLALALALLLAACGPAHPQETQGQPAQTSADQTTTGKAAQPPETTSAAEPVISTHAPTQEPTQEPTQAPTQEATEVPTTVSGVDQEVLAKAQSCIDKTVEELIALIGEPLTWDYFSSCLGDGKDGVLQYDGFYVQTYREGDTEIVRYVEEGHA